MLKNYNIKKKKKNQHLSTDNVLMMNFDSNSIHFNIKVYFLYAIGPTQRKFVLLNICKTKKLHVRVKPC